MHKNGGGGRNPAKKKTVVVSLSCELRLIYLILICFPEKGEFKILYPSYNTFLFSESCVIVCIP